MLIDSLIVFKPRCIYVLPSDFTVIGVIVLLWLFLHIKKAHLTISDSGSSIVRTFELRSSTQRCVVRKFKTWAEISENSTDIWYCWVLTVRADQLRWNLLNYLLESSGFSSQYSTTLQQPCVGERRKATTFQFGKYFADILVLDISKFINFIHFTGLLSL